MVISDKGIINLKNPICFGQLVDNVRTESIENLRKEIEKKTNFNTEIRLDKLAKKAKLLYKFDKQKQYWWCFVGWHCSS